MTVSDASGKELSKLSYTYDHDGKARETYSYGKGRASYLNNQTGDSYNYLTNQSGSVTGLTKDGQAVASSRYNITFTGQERQVQIQHGIPLPIMVKLVTILDLIIQDRATSMKVALFF